MSSVENNGRLVVFRLIGILSASEGAEGVPHGQGRAPSVGPLWAMAGGRMCPVSGPSGSPWSSGVLFRIKNLRKFLSNSENIFRSDFLKYKNCKNRELALGILSIG